MLNSNVKYEVSTRGIYYTSTRKESNCLLLVYNV